MKTFLKSPLLILLALISMSSCDDISLYDESVIINEVLNNEDQDPLVTQDITLTYVTSINNGLANNSLRFKVDLSPNIDLNSIIDLGLVYNNTSEPSLSDSKVSASSIEAINIIDVDQLLEGQTYYFKAYIITNQGIFYSSDEINAIVPQTDCTISTEDNHINEWYYLMEPDQTVYNASDNYEITVLSPANFNFSNQYEIFLYVNEDEVQYIGNGLDFESFYDNEGILTYTYNYSIPEGLTPSTCYTMRIIPAEWSNETDTAVSNPFMILQ